MAPTVASESIATSMLQPNPWNPNVMSQAMFAKALNSITEYGFIDPVTVMPEGAHYLIIDGEHRWRVALQLKMPYVPCIVLSGINKQAAKKLTTILNGLHGEPDPNKLSVLLKELVESEPIESLLSTMPFEMEQFTELAGITPFDWDAFNEQMSRPSQRDKDTWVERTYRMPSDAAAVIDRAIAAVGEESNTAWRALELICADYLSGLHDG